MRGTELDDRVADAGDDQLRVRSGVWHVGSMYISSKPNA